MKKTLFAITILFIMLSVIFCSFWGEKHTLPEGITKQEAIRKTMQMLDEKSKATIKNLNNPEVQTIVYNKSLSIYPLDEKKDIEGKTLYRIIYNTEQDGLLGPIAFYVDKLSGTLIGMDFRE